VRAIFFEIHIMNGCMCGGCRDCLRAQGYDEDSEAVDAVAATLLEEWASSPRQVGEASTCLTGDEHQAIERAHAAVNAEADPDKRRALKEAYFDVADKAVRRVLSTWADETARERLDKIRREAEADAFEMAMED
jgi:hypothetical protein